ncbi:hypothetical protein KJ359_000190 [Pestalotiopsis sp. 9143b]|nr:hypothetical protein KJ359_000190 [Pestalotiopsis sp. 9143b]
MSLCDTQLLTGISMLLSGFSSLNDFDYMSLTSWLMVANLAWFSNLTHQFFGTKQLAFQRDYLSQLGNDRLTFESSLDAEPESNRFDFGQVLPLMLLAGVALATRQAFQSGRTKSQYDVSTETTEFDAAKDSRSSSFAPTLVAPSEATSRIDHLLSRDIYLDNVWLLPTLFNIGSAIFLFFQLIVSSSGGNAASLFVSIAYSTTVD